MQKVGDDILKYRELSGNLQIKLSEIKQCVEAGQRLLEKAVERQRAIAKLSSGAGLQLAKLEKYNGV